jgi:hypothetical protein
MTGYVMIFLVFGRESRTITETPSKIPVRVSMIKNKKIVLCRNDF